MVCYFSVCFSGEGGWVGGTGGQQGQSLSVVTTVWAGTQATQSGPYQGQPTPAAYNNTPMTGPGPGMGPQSMGYGPGPGMTKSMGPGAGGGYTTGPMYRRDSHNRYEPGMPHQAGMMMNHMGGSMPPYQPHHTGHHPMMGGPMGGGPVRQVMARTHVQVPMPGVPTQGGGMGMPNSGGGGGLGQGMGMGSVTGPVPGAGGSMRMPVPSQVPPHPPHPVRTNSQGPPPSPLNPSGVRGSVPSPMTPGANPMTPGANPLTPGANPLTPGANPMTPGANPMTPGANVASPLNNVASPIPGPVTSPLTSLLQGPATTSSITSPASSVGLCPTSSEHQSLTSQPGMTHKAPPSSTGHGDMGHR